MSIKSQRKMWSTQKMKSIYSLLQKKREGLGLERRAQKENRVVFHESKREIHLRIMLQFKERKSSGTKQLNKKGYDRIWTLPKCVRHPFFNPSKTRTIQNTFNSYVHVFSANGLAPKLRDFWKWNTIMVNDIVMILKCSYCNTQKRTFGRGHHWLLQTLV